MFKTFATYLYIVLKHSLLKFLQKKLCEEQNQKSFSEYDWEELIYSGDIRSYSQIPSPLLQRSMEDLKKV